MENNTRILHICRGNLVHRGIEHYLLNLNDCINHKRFSVDILTSSKCLFDDLRKSINRHQGIMYELKIKKIPVIEYIIFFIKIKGVLSYQQYDIIEVDAGVPIMGIISALLAKNTKCLVSLHAHTSYKNNFRSLIKKIIFFPFMKEADYYFACSMKVGYDTFPRKVHKKITWIPNGIDVYKFRFQSDKRKKIRNELKIENQLVVGHIGAFAKEKNHLFLFDIFEKLLELKEDCVLLLVGDGKLKERYIKEVKARKISNKVIFFGTSNCVEELMSAMDVFCFPSVREALGTVVIEAQANGLPVLVSSEVPVEAAIINNYKTFELNKSAKEWAEELMRMKRDTDPLEDNKKVASSAYQLENSIRVLEKIYSGGVKRGRIIKSLCQESNLYMEVA